MQKSRLLYGLIGICTLVLIIVAVTAKRMYPAIAPVVQQPPGNIAEMIAENTTDKPLTLPAGFSIRVFTAVSGARDIEEDSDGTLWVSQPGQGTITKILRDETKSVAVSGLSRPHGLAFDPKTQSFFVAEERQVLRYALSADGSLSEPESIYQLPASRGGHWTRSLGIGPDDRLYVSVGSTCNVCEESEERYAAILSMRQDGTDAKVIAKGLRNAVFFTWQNGKMFATDMGRDHLGDDLPPEEVNVIQEGAHYGWPFCYAQKIRDTSYQRSNTFNCATTVAPIVEMPAHMAPLGLTFIPDSWPEEYRGDLLVAMHGSWNRSVPDGYKIIRVPMNANEEQDGPIEDFIAGWLQPGGALGRPVDLLIRKDGSLFITDDKAGLVYEVKPLQEATN